MKIKYNTIYLFLLIISLFVGACEKNAVQKIDTTADGAFVRFYNFALSAPSVNFYVNDVKVTATNSASGTEAITGVNAGGIFPANNNYLALKTTGTVSFKAFTPTTAVVDPNINVTNIAGEISEGKYYSFFTSGVYDAVSKTTSGFILEDVLPAVDTAFAYVRFVNTVPNATNGFDLKAVNTATLAESVITAPIVYQATSTYTRIPNGVYNLTATSISSPANNTITRASVSFVKGFVYTIASRGDALITTGANAKSLDLTRNR